MINALANFDLICSGADREILKKQECETDRAKYRMIGRFIFLTAVFATLSGGYALYTGFNSFWLAAAIGILWGLFIFNLDRYIISTLRKKDIAPDLPIQNKVIMKASEVLSALPRIIFAVFISIVISTPLELKYFDPEIQARISETNFSAAIDIEKTVEQEFPQVANLQKEIAKLEQDVSNKEGNCDRLRRESFGEAEGTIGTGKLGRGPVFREKQAEFEQCKKELTGLKSDTQPQINQKNEELRLWKGRRDARADDLKRQKEKGNGFLARLTALHESSSVPGPVGLATIFISLLFILLETTPLVMKLISKRGPYDDLLETSEYKVYLYSQKAISDLNEQVNNEIAFNTWKNNLVLATEQQMIQDALTDLETKVPDMTEAAQVEVATDFIYNWKNKSLAQGAILIAPQAQQAASASTGP